MRMRLALTLVPLLGAGCLFGPENNSDVCGANAPVAFGGFVPTANAALHFEVAASPSGPWQTFEHATSAASGYAYAGGTYYPFSKTVVVPTWVSDGTTLRSYVRVRAVISGYTVNLTTFDRPPPGGASGFTCMNNRVSAGDSVVAAVDACDSASAPVVALRAPAQSTCACSNTVVTGNLVIDSAVAAANYVCVTQVTGDLTIAESTPEYLYFPSLTSVGGDLDANYAFPGTGPSGTVYRRRTINLSALTTIGGDVRLFTRRDDGEKAAPQGLHAVTSVGGDITLTLRDTNPQVFNGLTSHAGNITIQGHLGGNLDINAGGSFTSLTSVGGSLEVRAFFNSNGFFNTVQSVGGRVYVGDVRLYPSPSFVALSSVAGDVVFEATKLLGPPWPTTTAIGGDLVVNGVEGMTGLANVPVTISTAGGLRLAGNGALTTLSGKPIQLTTRDVVISGNALLPQCRVNAFLTAQTAGGWTGVANVSGTAAGPCP